MVRLFVAIPLPSDIKRSLEPLASGLGDVRWTTPEQQHVTLRFIGEVDNGRADEMADMLSMVPGMPFDLRLKGIGHFPPRGEPRVIWAGVEKTAGLRDLKHRIDRVLRSAGLAADRQKFSPHVTLARLRRPPSRAGLATYLMRHSLYRSAPFTVGGFDLYSSRLRTDGPAYRLEASYHLTPGTGDGVRARR